MPVTVSTTTPSVVGSYSDPVRALNIKALEKRHAEMLQAQAQMGAITPENTQTPVQGMGHVLNQLGSSMQAGYAERKAQDARDRLSAVMAGIDWEKGPTPQQLAFITNANDALGTKLIEQGATSRENQRTRQHEVGQQQARFGHDTAQQTQRLTHEEGQQSRLFGQQDKTLATTQAFTANESEQERAFRRDQQSGSQAHETRLTNLRAQIDQKKQEIEHAHATGQTERKIAAERDMAQLTATLTGEENRRKEAHDTTQLQERLRSDRDLKTLDIEARSLENMLNRSHEYRISQEGRDAAVRLQEIKAEQEARAAVHQRMHEEKLAEMKISADATARASDPSKIKTATEIQQEALQAEALKGDLDQAKQALKDGINLGRYAGVVTGLPQLTGGVLGNQKMADNTVLFDNIMGKVAITAMGPMLKGQSTDYEMRTFIEMFNNKNISMEAKRAQFARVIEHADKNRALLDRAAKAAGGRPAAAPPTAAPAPASGGGAAAPAATGGGNVVDVASEADIQKLPPGSRFRLNGRTGTVQ